MAKLPVNDPLRKIQLDLEQRALVDFKQHCGKILLAEIVTGYDARGNSLDIVCDPPARVRVYKTTSHEDLQHWNDNWLDPYWDLELVTPHPALDGISSLWTFGLSYCTDGRTELCSEWTVEKTTFAQAIRDWWTTR